MLFKITAVLALASTLTAFPSKGKRDATTNAFQGSQKLNTAVAIEICILAREAFAAANLLLPTPLALAFCSALDSSSTISSATLATMTSGFSTSMSSSTISSTMSSSTPSSSPSMSSTPTPASSSSSTTPTPAPTVLNVYGAIMINRHGNGKNAYLAADGTLVSNIIDAGNITFPNYNVVNNCAGSFSTYFQVVGQFGGLGYGSDISSSAVGSLVTITSGPGLIRFNVTDCNILLGIAGAYNSRKPVELCDDATSLAVVPQSAGCVAQGYPNAEMSFIVYDPATPIAPVTPDPPILISGIIYYISVTGGPQYYIDTDGNFQSDATLAVNFTVSTTNGKCSSIPTTGVNLQTSTRTGANSYLGLDATILTAGSSTTGYNLYANEPSTQSTMIWAFQCGSNIVPLTTISSIGSGAALTYCPLRGNNDHTVYFYQGDPNACGPGDAAYFYFEPYYHAEFYNQRE